MNKDKMKEIGKKVAIGAGIAGAGIIGFALGAKSSQKYGVKLVKAGVKTGAIQGFNIGMHAGVKLKEEETKENFMNVVDEEIDAWAEGFVNEIASEVSNAEMDIINDQVVAPVTEGIRDLKSRLEKELE